MLRANQRQANTAPYRPSPPASGSGPLEKASAANSRAPNPAQTSQLVLKQVARGPPFTSIWVMGTTTMDAVALIPNATTTMTKENSPNSCADNRRRKISEATKCAPDTAMGPQALAP